MGRGFGSEQTKGWWVVGDDMYQVHIEEIALTSLRMQGLEEENERLKAQVAELEEQLKHTWEWVTKLEGENGGLVSENEALKTAVNRERYWKEKSEKGMKALLDFWYSDPDGVRPILDDSE